MSDAARPPKIRIRGLRKAFGDKRVLDGVDLDVASHSSTVVIGGSGTGKSVLLKCILGLIRPDAGSIEIDGVDVLRLSPRDAQARRARIGMLFQNGALFDGMQKRVALARAVATDPDIVLLDEPTTGLDPIMGAVIDELIVDTVKRLGSTAVAITHDMASAGRIADRAAMLYRGRIVWEGPGERLMTSGVPVVEQFTHGRSEGPISMELRR